MAVRGDGGAPLFLEGFLLDITQQKEAEERLRESQAELIELADAMPALIAFVDSDERYRFVNRTYLRWAGVEPQQMIGRKVREVVGDQVYENIEAHIHSALAGDKVEYEDFLSPEQIGEPSGQGSGRYFDVSFIPRITHEGLTDGFFSLAVDVTRRKRAETAQKLLVAELQHRTRNLLAIVQSIALQTLESSASLAAFGREFNDRLKVLGRVQGLLSSDRQDVTMADLVAGELAAHGAAARGARVTAEGPAVLLSAAVVQVLSLALHELATNALKHGALAQEQARLRLTWDVAAAAGRRWLTVRWIEEGVSLPPAPPAIKRGFGRHLIEQALPYDLDAETRFDLTPDGVHCEIRLPLT
jgi:PAS domain S-box-containing protein